MGSGAAQGGVKVTRLGSKYIYIMLSMIPAQGAVTCAYTALGEEISHDTMYSYSILTYSSTCMHHNRLSYILVYNAIYIQGGYILVWL